jgi:hypothetical protein
LSPEGSPATSTVSAYGIEARETGGGESKEIKSLGDRPVAHHHRAGDQRDNETDAETMTRSNGTLASQLNALFPD